MPPSFLKPVLSYIPSELKFLPLPSTFHNLKHKKGFPVCNRKHVSHSLQLSLIAQGLTYVGISVCTSGVLLRPDHPCGCQDSFSVFLIPLRSGCCACTDTGIATAAFQTLPLLPCISTSGCKASALAVRCGTFLQEMPFGMMLAEYIFGNFSCTR